MCLMGFFYIYDLTNLDRLKGTYLSSMTEVMSGLVHWREGFEERWKDRSGQICQVVLGCEEGEEGEEGGEENTNKAWTGICWISFALCVNVITFLGLNSTHESILSWWWWWRRDNNDDDEKVSRRIQSVWINQSQPAPTHAHGLIFQPSAAVGELRGISLPSFQCQI